MSRNSRSLKFLSVLLLSFVSISATAQAQDSSTVELDGLWDCHLQSPGGEIQFGMLVETDDESMLVYFINGPEKIKCPESRIDGHGDDRRLLLSLPHYDSKLVIKIDESKDSMAGTWSKVRGKDKILEMAFSGKRHDEHVVGDSVTPYLGKWSVDFSSTEDPAMAIVTASDDSDRRCWATFRTTTGDYRFLSGKVIDGDLVLSVFDGAHAFLFRAAMADDGTIAGDFWSSMNWHETWTATKSDDVEMPDPYAATTWNNEIKLASFKFPNLDGDLMSLNDEQFRGKPRLIHVFGSWCPNCHDAGIYLGELQKKYGEDLSILGLAFELTGDFDRDVTQVRQFHQKHETDYPTLIAGLADKKLASETIPFLDRVRSYPTTIFMDADGQVTDIHTGFNGPATGEAYDELREEFESRIDALIEKWKSK